MSYFLFVDESGNDRRDSPYEVLAGVSVRDRVLWDLIQEIQEAERTYFGRRITPGSGELKAKRLLKRKVFRLAGQMPALGWKKRQKLARSCLDKGDASKGSPSSGATRTELAALAQTKIAFVKRVLTICDKYGVKAFASIVPQSAPRPQGDFLRKDYAYLFERLSYYLEDLARESGLEELGIVVFDELERSRCHILHDQIGLYFAETAKGQARSRWIIPEPFFVHSELTTAIQIADLVAYIVSWGFRIPQMTEPPREELQPLTRLVAPLRYRTRRSDSRGVDHDVWSFAYIGDLRPREERKEEKAMPTSRQSLHE